MKTDVIINREALYALRELPSESVNCCVTSPPYYGLRDYGLDMQIGREDTPEQYIDRLVEVFRELRRVLKDDGTFWLNIADTYCGTGMKAGCKQKDLIGIPWLLALGTPATRAAVIEKLVNSGFVERKGKQLFPTKNGINLVCVLPDSLTSPKLTAEWENTLTLIAKGNANPKDFMQGIEAMAQELVKAYPFLSEKDKELFKEEKPVIGKCPRCGSPVHESKKNYYCSDRDCTFTMWKNDRFFEERKTVFTPKIAAALLKSGKASVKGLYSPKTGKTYDGNVVLADTGGKYVNYRVELPKKK